MFHYIIGAAGFTLSIRLNTDNRFVIRDQTFTKYDIGGNWKPPNDALNQWFSTGVIWPPRRPCRISEGPQVKVVKLGGAMETVK
jgi:hypothetical protein